MDDFIDSFKVAIWQMKRDFKLFIKSIKEGEKSFWCRIGFHRMRRGFGYGRDRRMDLCLKCDYSKWYADKTYSKK